VAVNDKRVKTMGMAIRMRVFFLATILFFQAFSPALQAQEPPPPPPAAEEAAAAAEDAVSEAAESAEETAEKTEAETPAPAPASEPSLLAKVNGKIFSVLFFDVAFGKIQIDAVDAEGKPLLDADGSVTKQTVGLPFLICILFFGAVFFTFFYRWINLRGLRHAFDVVRGKFDNPDDEGEISHFRALTSALSATVGLGNIAGVAIAIQVGGPGAVFWMMFAAIFGMSAKFSSCTLSQMYRKVNPDGSISGGPMYYIDLGLKAKGAGWAQLGKVLAVMYAFMVMGGAIGGGNMFQANQTVEAMSSTFDLGPGAGGAIGIIMAIFVALVILGGIKRIGAATSKLVPGMCCIYVLASLFIIFTNIDKAPGAIALIFKMAFTDNALFGGMIGVLIRGVRRASFSNEAGLGSAAIAHAAAKTDEPVREGMVAMVGPIIDTVIVCLMTAMVVIITGAWNDPSIPSSAGVALTTAAFQRGISWFPYVLTVCIVLFAYSTMISWCYYGERGWIYLLDHFGEGIGLKSVVVFRIVFVSFVYYGATNKLADVLDFSDAMILSMAFPNIVAMVILAPAVWKKAEDYWGRYTSGEMKRYDGHGTAAEAAAPTDAD
jgi:AGCS family alanine or glycine:cation symporter